MNPFDFIKDITTTKKYILTPENEGEYNPFLVNRALSYYRDCIILANEMNLKKIPPKMQHDFLFHLIRGYKRRYIKWEGREVDDKISTIMKYFKVSSQKAKEIEMILSDHEIETIKTMTNVGGIDGKRKGNEK